VSFLLLAVTRESRNRKGRFAVPHDTQRNIKMIAAPQRTATRIEIQFADRKRRRSLREELSIVSQKGLTPAMIAQGVRRVK
jgi:hypothetical protein